MNANDFELVQRWMELNRDVLNDYWNGDIEYTEMLLPPLNRSADRH
jgi:hypothetical protein